MGSVAAFGCGGSSSKSDGGHDGEGAGGNFGGKGGTTGAGGSGGSAGGATGAAGSGTTGAAGTGTAGSAGTTGNGGGGGAAGVSGAAGNGGASGSAGTVGSGGAGGGAGRGGSGGSAGSAGAGGRGGSGGNAGTAGNGGSGTGGRGGGAAGTGGGAGTAGTGGAAGSAGSNGSCLQVEPCGGNIVGSWQMTTQCLNVASLQPTPTSACPDASVTAATGTISGNATFNADMTYSTTSAQTLTFYWHFPNDCLSGQTCDDLAATGQAGLPAGVTFTCSGTTDCDCIETASGTSTDSGTYSVSGSNLLTNSTTNGAATGLYCVQGSTIHFVSVDTTTNNGPGGGPTITRDIVGQKQ